MTTQYYKCIECRNDVSHSGVWEEPEGHYCYSCLFMVEKNEYNLHNDRYYNLL